MHSFGEFIWLMPKSCVPAQFLGGMPSRVDSVSSLRPFRYQLLLSLMASVWPVRSVAHTVTAANGTSVSFSVTSPSRQDMGFFLFIPTVCREGLVCLYLLWGRTHRTVCLKHFMFRSCARVCGYRSHFHHPTQSNIPLQGYLILEDDRNSRMLPSSSKSNLITSRHIKPFPAIFSFILHGPRENSRDIITLRLSLCKKK